MVSFSCVCGKASPPPFFCGGIPRTWLTMSFGLVHTKEGLLIFSAVVLLFPSNHIRHQHLASLLSPQADQSGLNRALAVMQKVQNQAGVQMDCRKLLSSKGKPEA